MHFTVGQVFKMANKVPSTGSEVYTSEGKKNPDFDRLDIEKRDYEELRDLRFYNKWASRTKLFVMVMLASIIVAAATVTVSFVSASVAGNTTLSQFMGIGCIMPEVCDGKMKRSCHETIDAQQFLWTLAAGSSLSSYVLLVALLFACAGWWNNKQLAKEHLDKWMKARAGEMSLELLVESLEEIINLNTNSGRFVVLCGLRNEMYKMKNGPQVFIFRSDIFNNLMKVLEFSVTSGTQPTIVHDIDIIASFIDSTGDVFINYSDGMTYLAPRGCIIYVHDDSDCTIQVVPCTSGIVKMVKQAADIATGGEAIPLEKNVDHSFDNLVVDTTEMPELETVPE